MCPVNKLIYGDNLTTVPEYVEPESVDLVYLDPPFNSNRSYNVLFGHQDEPAENAQIQAFDDTWHWSPETEATYIALIGGGVPAKVADALESMHGLVGEGDLMAYLVMMAPRLVGLHNVLKPTGSLYLHADPTASHYLKVLLDAIFGPEHFRNEIIWRRTGWHSPRKSYGPIHDTLLFYTRTQDYYFRINRRPYMKGHVDSRYTRQDDGRLKFTSGGNVLTGAGTTGGESGQPWRGFDPSAKNRHWAIPGFIAEELTPEEQALGVQARLERLYEMGLIEITEGNAWPTPVRYLRDGDGQPMSDIWAYQPYTEGTVYGTADGIDADVQWLGPTDPERLGFHTQKPLGLLRRVIASSCPDGGLVLDPFCGCGTAVVVAQEMGRRWIGVDIAYIAVHLIETRLRAAFPDVADFEVKGIPSDVGAAQALFARSHFEFERWAVSRVNGQPKEKPGGDKGVDGIIRFPIGAKEIGRAVVSVKGGGQLSPDMVRDLVGTAQTQKAEMGVLVLLDKPTKGMTDAAEHAGIYAWPVNGTNFPRIQIMTIDQLLSGKKPNMPPSLTPYFKAAAFVPPTDQPALDI
jgi:DNA modification methylase